jgi:hypothetical protein
VQPAARVGGTCRARHLSGGVLDALVTLIFLSITALFVWNGEFLDYKWINHDVANALYIGKRMLQGDRLYIDWYYYVTPPIVLLSAGACWVAGLLRITPITTIHLLPVLGAILGLFSIWSGKSKRFKSCVN